MAGGKKSFLMYADYQELFHELSDEDAGQLIKHILAYVNDEDPETENQIVKVSFIPIKRQLKRDLRKYEERAERSRQNGASGGRPPKNPEKPSGLLVNPKKPEKPDTDNDTVNDNDNVIDINTKRLADWISEKWNFSEISNFPQYKMLVCFIQKFGVDTVKGQYDGYWAYKNLTGERTHSFKNWLGPPPNYGGAWNEKDWQKAYKKEKESIDKSRKNDTVVEDYGSLQPQR